MDKARTRPAAVVHLIAPGSSLPRRTAPELVNLTVEADDRLLLTVQEAARRLGIGRSLMYELIASGAVRSVRVGRLRRIPSDALRSYIASLWNDGDDDRNPDAS
jgi:excisionase family DNA binding protein